MLNVCFLSGGNLPSAKFPHMGNRAKWDLVHVNEACQIYAGLSVVGFNFTPAHFVPRINVSEDEVTPRLKVWLNCPFVSILFEVSLVGSPLTDCHRPLWAPRATPLRKPSEHSEVTWWHVVSLKTGLLQRYHLWDQEADCALTGVPLGHLLR